MTIHDIPPERFYEMSRALFKAAKIKRIAYGMTSDYKIMYERRVTLTKAEAFMDNYAKEIGHLAGLAWLAHEAGEAAEREK